MPIEHFSADEQVELEAVTARAHEAYAFEHNGGPRPQWYDAGHIAYLEDYRREVAAKLQCGETITAHEMLHALDPKPANASLIEYTAENPYDLPGGPDDDEQPTERETMNLDTMSDEEIESALAGDPFNQAVRSTAAGCYGTPPGNGASVKRPVDDDGELVTAQSFAAEVEAATGKCYSADAIEHFAALDFYPQQPRRQAEPVDNDIADFYRSQGREVPSAAAFAGSSRAIVQGLPIEPKQRSAGDDNFADALQATGGNAELSDRYARLMAAEPQQDWMRTAVDDHNRRVAARTGGGY